MRVLFLRKECFDAFMIRKTSQSKVTWPTVSLKQQGPWAWDYELQKIFNLSFGLGMLTPHLANRTVDRQAK